MPLYLADSSEGILKAEIDLFQNKDKEGMKRDWGDVSVGKVFAELWVLIPSVNVALTAHQNHFLALDGDHHTDPYLAKMPSTSDCEVPTPSWYIYNTTLHLTKDSGKTEVERLSEAEDQDVSQETVPSV